MFMKLLNTKLLCDNEDFISKVRLVLLPPNDKDDTDNNEDSGDVKWASPKEF